jgi:hypothetical protein
MSQLLAHFHRSLRCGDRVRLQDYICRASEATGMPHVDPQQTSVTTLVAVHHFTELLRADLIP